MEKVIIIIQHTITHLVTVLLILPPDLSNGTATFVVQYGQPLIIFNAEGSNLATME